jgi:hypothetical protein
MARLARLVISGFPRHVTQRGNRRQPMFFNDGDYAMNLRREFGNVSPELETAPELP